MKEGQPRQVQPVSAERHAEVVRLADHYQGLWLNASGELSLAREKLNDIERAVEDVALGAAFDLKLWKNDPSAKFIMQK